MCIFSNDLLFSISFSCSNSRLPFLIFHYMQLLELVMYRARRYIIETVVELGDINIAAFWCHRWKGRTKTRQFLFYILCSWNSSNVINCFIVKGLKKYHCGSETKSGASYWRVQVFKLFFVDFISFYILTVLFKADKSFRLRDNRQKKYIIEFGQSCVEHFVKRWSRESRNFWWIGEFSLKTCTNLFVFTAERWRWIYKMEFGENERDEQSQV